MRKERSHLGMVRGFWSPSRLPWWRLAPRMRSNPAPFGTSWTRVGQSRSRHAGSLGARVEFAWMHRITSLK